MNDSTNTSPQMPTYDDMRRLLNLANALHATPGADRPRRLAGALLDLLGTHTAGVYLADAPGDPPRLLAFASGTAVAPGDETPAPPVGRTGPVHEVLSLPPEGAVPAAMVSVYREGGRVSVLAAWRPGPFDARHALLLRLLHPEAAWIFDQAFARADLPLGTAAVLDLMLEGLPEKAIATRLRRSVHTVHSHVKRIYRHYGVSSRPALLARHFDQRGDAR